MKICVVGAGAIGGLVGGRMAQAGHEVTLIARGPHLQQIRAKGLTLIDPDGMRSVAKVAYATDNLAEAGTQDAVILALKAHQLRPVVDDLRALCHNSTVFVPMQNGIPFWYFRRHGGPYEGRTVDAVDPGGELSRKIAPERIIGCVVYPAAEIMEPGVINHVEGFRFPLGELDGQATERVRALSQAFEQAGFKSPILEDIRSEIWLKLWGNLSFNPISALTHSTLGEICRYGPARELARCMMLEAQTVGEHLGVHFRVPIDKRIAGAERVGEHKTSMLQDVESGKEPEIDALVGALLEIARLINVPMPYTQSVYALTKTLAEKIRRSRLRVHATPAGISA
ncbi:MAG TPA: 2-dehydropantoate 2-reductase [Burkholderiales bacterium]|jgi:2-dehydropantoate 2-reductase